MNTPNKLQINQVIPAFAAKAGFSKVLDGAEEGHRVLISRNGVPTAIIIGIEDYLTAVLEQPELLTAFHKKAKAAGLDQLTLEEIDQEIETARTESESRYH